MDSREALIHAINDYNGAVILISHDRHLIAACADRLWLVSDGTVTPYDGDIASYREQCLAERGAGRAAKSSSSSRTGVSRQQQRRQGAERRAARAPLKSEMTRKEQKVKTISASIAALDERLGDKALYDNDPDAATQLARQRGELAKALEQAEAEWLAASEAYEGARH